MKRFLLYVLTAGGLSLGLLGVATVALRADVDLDSLPGPSDALWNAMVKVESGGNPHAYNPNDGASGIAQIRTVCLDDTNRIARQRGLDARFAPADRFNPRQARRIWSLYLAFYGREYARQTGDEPTDETYARIWNGGPTGWRKSSTVAYWGRVRAALEADPAP